MKDPKQPQTGTGAPRTTQPKAPGPSGIASVSSGAADLAPLPSKKPEPGIARGLVMYRLPDFPAGTKDTPGTMRLRPAIVTQGMGSTVNLRVFLDNANDLDGDQPLGSCAKDGTATSVSEGGDEGQFRPGRFYPT